MPIKPENKARYPKNWKSISDRIRFRRARGRCECAGECGTHEHECRAMHEHYHPITGSVVRLTVAHLDHTPENCDDENLKAMCQRCHLNYDIEHHKKTQAAGRRCKSTADLFDVSN